MSALPSLYELAAMWPAWFLFAFIAFVWLYAGWEDSQQWKRWERRMRQREKENKLSRQFNRRN